jgi:predicted PolB exonuclease-like 3'-5' exonuclease
MNVLAFDIETIPDIEGGRRLYDLGADLSDEDVTKVMFSKQRDKSGNDFLPSHLQRVCAVSAAYRNTASGEFNVWSLGTEESTEAELIERFFSGIDKYTPTLVTWNGSGFDLPVMQQRGLINGVPAARYWDTGEDDQQFKWNNYISRYHARHIDLMDVLASYNNRAFAPLDQMAVLLGLPGKMGMDGSKVCGAFLEGKIKEIRDYCETDALNTYLVYLHWLLVKGSLSKQELEQEQQVVRQFLQSQTEAEHFQAFLAGWKSN